MLQQTDSSTTFLGLCINLYYESFLISRRTFILFVYLLILYLHVLSTEVCTTWDPLPKCLDTLSVFLKENVLPVPCSEHC